MSHSLHEALAPGPLDADALHGALEWLLQRQGRAGSDWTGGISSTAP